MDDPKPLVGRYRFQQRLPSSGKSATWLARDEQTRGRVVIGTLPVPRARGLLRLVGLDHPHIASVLQVLDDAEPNELPEGVVVGNQALVVAEHVTGRTLAQRIDTASVPVPRAVTWLMRLARALREVHARGGVLGAISPRTVIVIRDGAVPVFTHMMASPSGAYCSPTRVQGGGPTPEDDVWALHGVLHTALSRGQPFHGTTRSDLAEAILAGAFVSLEERGIDDRALNEVLRQGFDVDAPCADASELEAKLLDWIKQGAEVEGLAPRLSTRPPPAVAEREAPGQEYSRADESALGPQAIDGLRVDLRSADPLNRVHPAAKRELPQTMPAPHFPPAASWNVTGDATASPAPALERRPGPDANSNHPDAGASTSRPMEPWDDRTAPALPRDIQALARAHAALAAGEQEARGNTPGAPTAAEPGAEPEPQPRSEAGAVPASPRGHAFYSFADAEEETARFTDDDLRELGVDNSHPAEIDDAVNGARLAPPPEPGLHPPSIVINQSEAYRARMETLPPSGLPSQADLETQVRRAAATPPKSRVGAITMVLLAALVAAGAIGLLVMRSQRGGAALAPSAQPAALPTPLSEVPVPGAPSAKAPSTPLVASAPEPITPPPVKSGEALYACVVSHFPEATFPSTTQDFGFVCSDRDPRQLAKSMHRQIVVGGQGQISAGMREWSLLSWHELAAVSVIQRTCCGDVGLELPSPVGCEPLAAGLQQLAQLKDEPSVSDVEARIACLYDKQAPRPYRYGVRPDSGNKTALLAFLKRARERSTAE